MGPRIFKLVELPGRLVFLPLRQTLRLSLHAYYDDDEVVQANRQHPQPPQRQLLNSPLRSRFDYLNAIARRGLNLDAVDASAGAAAGSFIAQTCSPLITIKSARRAIERN